MDLPLDVAGTLELHAYRVQPDGQIVRDSKLIQVATARKELFQLAAEIAIEPTEERLAAMRESELAFKTATEAFLAQPLREAAQEVAKYSPWVQKWLDNLEDPDADYWRRSDWMDNLDGIDIPMLHVVGWHDLLFEAACERSPKFQSSKIVRSRS